jgi:AcrR family transcriptional regulator
MRPSKRNEIIEATIELVAERGIHDVPTVRIAEKAEVAEITLFRNFQSKEGLLNLIFDEVLRKVQTFIFEEIDETLPTRERFLSMCRRFCQFKVAYPKEFGVFEQYYLLPIWGRQQYLKDPVGTTSFTKGHRKGMIRLLLDGQKAGEVRQMPLATLIGMILGAIFHIDPELDAVMKEDIYRMLWEAISEP